MSNVSRAKTIGRLLTFKTNDNGIEIIDHIERRRCRVNTQYNAGPTYISTEKFHFPVDRGISITTSKILLPYSVAVSIRNHAGIMISQLTSGDYKDLPPGQYDIGFSTPIKLYLIVDSGAKIKVTSSNVKIEFNDMNEVFLGARSHHKHPAGKITTSSEPGEMMEAVSYLSSALKTTTCERSYPSLRGHPPQITLNDELQIPQILEKPETGVEIEIQSKFRDIYVVSPLAFYLGADIILGESRVIRTAHGFSYSLDDTDRGFEREVERVLKQCFFIDCLTRTEGYYNVSLHEREQLEQEINVDFAVLYNQSIPEQIKNYLNIPYDSIKSHLPKWKQTAYIETVPGNIEVLPFLVHNLATIRSADSANVVQSSTEDSTGADELPESRVDSMSYHGQEKSTREGSMPYKKRSGESVDPEEYVQIPDDNSLDQTWVGSGIPVGASKSMLAAFKNRLEREPVEGNIEISIVVNNQDMIEEGKTVDEVYETREQLKLSADVYHQLTTSELHELLQQDTDFIHYIGHIDRDGFECVDEKLDVTEINNVRIDSFFLNACSSYKQAIGLINAGSMAGIATTNPVLNSGAERVGKAVARLLNLGFPLVASLSIAKSKSLMGDNYVVIGDGSLDLTQPINGAPAMCDVERGESGFKIIYITYLTRKQSIGSITMPNIKSNNEFYLTSGKTGKFETGIDDVLRFFSKERMPAKLESNLHWTDEISINELANDN